MARAILTYNIASVDASLVPMKIDVHKKYVHVKLNNAVWAKHKSKWSQKLLISNENPSLGSWLEEVSLNPLKLRCRVCHAARSKCPMASGRSLTPVFANLKRHGVKKFHTTNAQRWVQLHSCGFKGNAPLSSDSAPSESEFQAVLDDIRKWKATGSAGKDLQKSYCLSEALKCKMQKDQLISTYVRYDIIMNLSYDIKLLRNLYYYRIKLEANPRVNIP